MYYIQYAHARVASVMKQLAARGTDYDATVAYASLGQLDSPQEQALLRKWRATLEVISAAAAARAPHALVHYLRDLANAFHTWYNAATFLVDDPALRNARLALALAAQQVMTTA